MTTYVYLTLAVAITLLAAFIEAHGYSYSFEAFRGEKIDFSILGLSFGLYSLGIVIDYVGLSIMSKSSIFIPELLSTIFMVGTIVGIAMISGQFLTWKAVDQTVAVGIVAGLGWLTWRLDK
jgi:hypothetical protein